VAIEHGAAQPRALADANIVHDDTVVEREIVFEYALPACDGIANILHELAGDGNAMVLLTVVRG